MKVGSRTTIYNANMRRRRNKIGLTQVELAKLCNVSLFVITDIEQLKQPSLKSGLLAKVLIQVLPDICMHLKKDIDYLFPPDYIALLKSGLLIYRPNTWVTEREIDIKQLADSRNNILAIEDEQAKKQILDIEEKVYKEQFLKTFNKLSKHLTEKELRVIELRYGLGDTEPHTYPEIARKLGVSRERIRQLEGGALSKLRNPISAKLLIEFMPEKQQEQFLKWRSVQFGDDEKYKERIKTIHNQRRRENENIRIV